LVALASTGCSVLLTTKAPSQADLPAPSAPIQCTSSRAAPIVDAALAALEAARTAVDLSVDESKYRGAPLGRNASAGFGIGLGTIFAASAVYGFVVTARCDAVKQSRGAESRGE
jgi:hypothetical protein